MPFKRAVERLPSLISPPVLNDLRGRRRRVATLPQDLHEARVRQVVASLPRRDFDSADSNDEGAGDTGEGDKGKGGGRGSRGTFGARSPSTRRGEEEEEDEDDADVGVE